MPRKSSSHRCGIRNVGFARQKLSQRAEGVCKSAHDNWCEALRCSQTNAQLSHDAHKWKRKRAKKNPRRQPGPETQPQNRKKKGCHGAKKPAHCVTTCQDGTTSFRALKLGRDDETRLDAAKPLPNHKPLSILRLPSQNQGWKKNMSLRRDLSELRLAPSPRCCPIQLHASVPLHAVPPLICPSVAHSRHTTR